MEQKTVEQIIAIKAWEASRIEIGNWSIDMDDDYAFRTGYIKGYTHAQQSQPMWREIEPTLYYPTHYMRNKDSAILRSGAGWELLRDGYTHYLSSEDLLKLPTEIKSKKKTIK